MLDPRLAPLIAEYIRGGEGAYEVLSDALLERSIEPLAAGDEPADRLDRVFVRLPVVDQVRIGSASLRRLVSEIVDHRVRALVSAALDVVDATPAGTAVDALRNRLFRAWQRQQTGPGARVVWAAWMLLRGLPAVSSSTSRAIRPGEIDMQIALVAAAFAR
ncbi:MAG: hypothetical protein ABI467_18770 [Kofleriaceae bacterium]